MCAQRLQRYLLSFMLIFSIALLHMGYFFLSTYLVLFIAVMVFIWATFDFCPALILLEKIFPPCKFAKKS